MVCPGSRERQILPRSMIQIFLRDLEKVAHPLEFLIIRCAGTEVECKAAPGRVGERIPGNGREVEIFDRNNKGAVP